MMRKENGAIELTQGELGLLGKDIDRVVAKKLGVSIPFIAQKRGQLNIPSCGKNGHGYKIKWAQDDLNLLGKIADDHLARKMGISRLSVFYKRTSYNIPACHSRGGLLAKIGDVASRRVYKRIFEVCPSIIKKWEKKKGRSFTQVDIPLCFWGWRYTEGDTGCKRCGISKICEEFSFQGGNGKRLNQKDLEVISVMQNRGDLIKEEETMVKSKEIMNVEDVAKYLGFTTRTIYKLVKEEGFPSVKIGGRNFRFRKDMINKWLDSKIVKDVEAQDDPYPERARKATMGNKKERENRIRKYREAKKIKQFELALNLGINNTRLSQLENWYIFPRGNEKVKLAKALNVEVKELFPYC